MITLSIRQPWAWLIIHAGKDIENREWRSTFEGRIQIHAGKTMGRAEYEHAVVSCEVVSDKTGRLIQLPPPSEIPLGGIVGSVEIFGCVTESESPWVCGAYGFLLRDPRPSEFYPVMGRLGFFDVKAPQLASTKTAPNSGGRLDIL